MVCISRRLHLFVVLVLLQELAVRVIGQRRTFKQKLRRKKRKKKIKKPDNDPKQSPTKGICPLVCSAVSCNFSDCSECEHCQDEFVEEEIPNNDNSCPSMICRPSLCFMSMCKTCDYCDGELNFSLPPLSFPAPAPTPSPTIKSTVQPSYSPTYEPSAAPTELNIPELPPTTKRVITHNMAWVEYGFSPEYVEGFPNFAITVATLGASASALAFVHLVNIVDSDIGIQNVDNSLFPRFYLATLYYSTDGDKWTNSDKWLSKKSECEWFGVVCDTNDEVIGLELNSNNLKGGLPYELGKLSTLRELHFQHNFISSLDVELGYLADLKVLELQHNSIVGMIPTIFSNLLSLNALDLRYNQLTGSIPEDSLESLTSLEYVRVEGNMLTGTLISNALCTSEKYFSYECEEILSEYCSQCFICDEMNQSCGFNDLTELLVENFLLGEGVNLTALNNENSPQYKAFQFIVDSQGIEPSYETLLQRYILAILYYSTDGPNWKISTKWLSYSHECDWLGIICNENGNIHAIDLQSNNLQGDLPNELSLLDELEIIILNDNSIFSLGQKIGDLAKLKNLEMRKNSISGSIPSTFENLLQLKVLDLRHNQLTGSIPEYAFESLSKLEYFRLEGNKLTGTLASSALCSSDIYFSYECEEIQYECLSQCYVCDEYNEQCDYKEAREILIKESLLTEGVDLAALNDNTSPQYKALKFIADSDGMQLSHDDPLLLQRYSLATFYYSTDGQNWKDSTNWLSDKELEWWKGVGTDENGVVNSIYLELNDLGGSIPDEIGFLTSIEWIKLRMNSIGGTIPSSIGRLTEIWRLELHHNDLTGSIPEEAFSDLTKLAIFRAYGNHKLTGHLTSSGTICNSPLGNKPGYNGNPLLVLDCYIPCDCCPYCYNCNESTGYSCSTFENFSPFI